MSMEHKKNKEPGIILDLGCGANKYPGAIGVDNVFLNTVDIIYDLLFVPYPFSTGCVDQVILSHVLEHFSYTEIDLILTEVYRVLSSQGNVIVSVPHAFSVAFHSDPTHKTSFTFETMYYFTPDHHFSYYKSLNSIWKIEKLWASVNLLNNKFVQFK